MIDYYRVGDRLLAEEFVLAADGTTVGLRGALWSTTDGRWQPAAELSRRLRTDAVLRGTARTVAPDATLPAPAFGDGYLPLPVSPPLHLTATGNRLYRLLFAGELSTEDIAALRRRWRLATPCAARGGHVIGSGHRRVGDDVFSWDLRRIGGRIAWCVDLTAPDPGSGAVGPMLRELGTDMRHHGMLPVTVERFS